MHIGRSVLDEAGEFGLKEGFALSLRTLDGPRVGFSQAGGTSKWALICKAC